MPRAQSGPPPVITTQPESQTAQFGSNATFSVVAVSGTTLRYKWLFNGRNAANGFGNTSPSFTVTNLQSQDAGLYSVEIKNANGLALSSNATLTVIAPPATLAAPQMTAGGFRLQLVGVPDTTYVIEATTNLADWIPLSTNTAPTGSTTFTDSAAIHRARGYYRARVLALADILEQSVVGNDEIEIKLAQRGAQSFQHGVAGYSISKVVLYLSREVEAPNANLRFNIGTGVNSGALAGSSVTIAPADITNTSAGVSFQTYEIAFGTPVGPLTAEMTYYLNLECEASNGKAFFSDYSDSDTYPRGAYFKSGANDSKDIKFQIWGY